MAKAGDQVRGGRSAAGAGVYVALLRGVNVGGRNRLPMAALARLLADTGCVEIRTLIQSGNAVFRASPSKAKRLAEDLGGRIEHEFGFRPRVILRSAAEMGRIGTAHPLAEPGLPDKALHVAFLDREPTDAEVARLDPSRSPGDRFVVRGAEMYVCLPRGVAESKLTTAYVDSALSATSTWRNWNTVRRLREMSSVAG
ncbi:MAG: DUF1697 domain-containing protein [Phycisphaerales bacterium]|nr:DUF1697 domain-containing protein [Phycisphaerales bacterium]